MTAMHVLRLPYTFRLAIFFKFGFFSQSNDRSVKKYIEKDINIGGEMAV